MARMPISGCLRWPGERRKLPSGTRLPRSVPAGNRHAWSLIHGRSTCLSRPTRRATLLERMLRLAQIVSTWVPTVWSLTIIHRANSRQVNSIAADRRDFRWRRMRVPLILDNTPPVSAITQPSPARYPHSAVLTLGYTVGDGGSP